MGVEAWLKAPSRGIAPGGACGNIEFGCMLGMVIGSAIRLPTCSLMEDNAFWSFMSDLGELKG